MQEYIGCCMFLDHGSVVVELLFIAAPIDCGDFVFDSCFVMQYFVSFVVYYKYNYFTHSILQ